MSSTRTLSTNDYQVGWIAALSTERAAATALLDELHETPTDFSQRQADSNAYTWGHVSGHNVVIASLPAGVYGLAAATATAQGLISSLSSIKIGLLVGIGAGIPESGLDVRLGDVAVSKPEGTTGGVVQYDIGKIKADGQWERVGVLRPPPMVLLKALAKLQAEHEIQDSQIPTILEEASKKRPKFASNYSHPGVDHDRLFHVVQDGSVTVEEETQRPKRDSFLPQVHYGTIASGNTVVKDAHTRQRIVAAIAQPCICLEMEAAGLMNDFPCLVIRGICDYADSHKNDIWHKYASATAAAFAKELLYHVPQFELNHTQKISDLLGDIQSSIDDLKEDVRHAEQQVQQKRQDDMVSELKQGLYTCPYLDRKNRNPTRVAGTCEWFIGHQRFKDWRDGGGPGLLWTSADPGCGKSTLARYLVDEVLPASGKKVCYFFFKDDFPDQKSSNNAICALFRQFLGFYPELITPEMLEKYNNDRPLYVNSFQTLWEEFTDAASQAPSNQIVCILDALDECQEQDRQKLIKNICEYTRNSWTAPKMKFLVTSRFHIDIKDGFYELEKSWSKIHLSGEGDEEVKKISREIDIVIKHRIKEISAKRRLTDDEEGFLTARLISQPQRTYLWAYLTLDIIEKMPEFSKGTVSRVITQLPNTVNEAYDRILNRSLDKDKAKLLLHLIVVAERPLSLEELSVMLALDGKQLTLSDLHAHIEPQERFQTTIRTLCGLFVVVKDARVYLFHQTAREFLISRRGDREFHDDKNMAASHSWKGALQLDASHKMIVERCLWLLDLRKYSEESTNTSILALFDYRDYFWPYHFRNSDVKADDDLTSLAVLYSDITYPQNCKIWDDRTPDDHSSKVIRELDVYRLDGDRHLNCLCLLGLTEIAVYFLKRNKFSFGEKKVISRALCWAAFGGHTDTAHLLLESGALANSYSLQSRSSTKILHTLRVKARYASGRFYKSKSMLETSNFCKPENLILVMSRTPLHSALWELDYRLVKSLLSMGAQINVAETTWHYTPLHIAAHQGSCNIIQLLLDHGADRKLLNRYGHTPLHTFYLHSKHGGDCTTITSLLWNNTADATHDGRFLWSATSLGCRSCLAFMLKNFKGVPNRDQQMVHALIKAIECNHDDLATLLIQSGVNVNSSGQNGITPLMQAAARIKSGSSIAKYLLDHGADPNIRDSMGCSCVHHVRTTEALEVLLAYKVDINTRDYSGTTPLLQIVLGGSSLADQLERPNQSTLYSAMVRLGADPDIENKYGQTARTPHSPTPRRFKGNFSASSYDACLDGGMNLTASCKRLTGKTISGTINLRNCLGNKNGKFLWTADGDFFPSARYIRLLQRGKILEAELLDDQGNWNEAYVFLDERIENRDGALRFMGRI